MKEMRPYTGAVGQMIGPGWFGYVDGDQFLYGEKGGRFLREWASICQEPYTDEGEKRLPVWSERGNDDIIVACPSTIAFSTVGEGENEGLVWVHKISRNAEHWRHDKHPKCPESIAEDFRKMYAKLRKFVSETDIKCILPSAPTMITLPIVDEKDGTKKLWQVSSTSSAVQRLLEMGKIGRTAGGSYYLIDTAPLVL